MRYCVLCCVVASASTMLGASVEIRTSELPWGIVHSGYEAAIETGVDGRCPSGTVRLSLGGGQLPEGLELRGSSIAGTPKRLGAFHFTLRASNDCGAATRQFDLVVTGKPILQASPQEVSFTWRAGEAPPDARILRFSSTWPDLPYTVRTEAPWINANETGGATPPEGSALAANTIALQAVVKDLAPGVYRSRVTISTWIGPAVVVIPVKLTVRPAVAASAAR